MFALTTFLQDSSGESVGGVLSVYSLDNQLVSRDSSVDGVVLVNILNPGEYVLRVSSENHTFNTVTVDVPDDGEGETTLKAIPVPSRTPIGASWCSVSGRFINALSETIAVTLSFYLLSGDYDVGENIIMNHTKCVSSERDGEIHLQLLRGRTYRLTFLEVPGTNVCSKTIYIPNRDNASIYDIIYPYAGGGVIDRQFTGSGDYSLTITLTDGRVLSLYTDVVHFIHSVEADNAEVDLIESESGEALLRVSGQPGAVVRVTGNRRGNVEEGPADTVQVRGDVFLTLVS